jgi:hypothetical protein
MPHKTRRNIDYVTLKDSFHKLIDRCGGIESAASKTRVGATSLYNYANRNMADSFPPIDVVYDLECHARTANVTESMCGMHGLLPVQLDCSDTEITVSQSIAELAKEHADVFAKTAEAMSDGQLTPAEAVVVLPEIAEAMHALMRFERQVRALADLKPTALGQHAADLRGQNDDG